MPKRKRELVYAGDCAKLHTAVPKYMTDFRLVEAWIDKEIEALTPKGSIPQGVSIMRVNAFREIYRSAMLELYKKLEAIECPECGHETELVCAKCSKKLSIEFPENYAREVVRLKETALKILADKFAPNLQAVSTQVDVAITIQQQTNFFAQVILEFVPDNRQPECLTKIQQYIDTAKKNVSIQ
jgi:DNA-directed RNA polymerase subunit RPC12/RpoP